MSARSFNRRQAFAGLGSLFAASPLLQAQAPKLIGEPPGRIAPHDELINTLEFEPMAERKLDAATFTKIAGSDRSAFDRMTFQLRLMVNTMDLDLSVELFGDKLFAPILVGPASHQKQFHPEGELLMARGAAAGQAAMVVSDRSSFPIEEIAAAARTPLWYQVYPEADAAAVVRRAQKAAKAGCKAVCITVGTPPGPRAPGNLNPSQPPAPSNPAVDWDYIDRLRQQIDIPVLLKGVMSAEEAQTAVQKGVEGIVVSNHGGRFLTGLAHPVTELPAIADAAGDKVPILIDGSFRRGSDILKALALGARAVLLTRPPLWGLAAYGADGVQSVIELLQTELAGDMAMIGAPNLNAIARDMVRIHKR
jgi:isopentenyl diphosphate isomerase/L-lactate dehydrogenase-like FMN-dependent dehydrogenase